jgi:uncharacterized repeat protein (TIGR01451 family)
MTYTIEVGNVGEADADFVRVVDTPDDNFTYTGASTTRGSCALDGSLTGGTLDCDLGLMEVNSLATIIVTGHFAAIVDHDIENNVSADPEDLIVESDELNNFASISARLMVHTPTGGPAATRTPTRPRPTPPGEVQGDANGDGRIDSVDAFWVLLRDAGLIDELPEEGAGDVNKDGVTNSVDALGILLFAAGLIDEFPP